MEIDLSRFKQSFIEEAAENLGIIEDSLLELERAGSDKELLDRVFRAAHSIKGGSGTFALTELGEFTHAMESLLDPLRSETLQFTSDTCTILLQATDVLRDLIAAADSGGPPPANMDDVRRRLQSAVSSGASSAAQDPAGSSGTSQAPPQKRRYRVSFIPHPNLFASGMDPVLLIRNLGELGELHDVVVDRSAIPMLAELEPEQCHLRWQICLTCDQGEAEIRDVFAFVEDECDLEISAVDEKQAQAVASSTTEPDQRQPAAGSGSRPKNGSAAGHQSTLRVSTDKLDTLVNLVGELVIAQAMITQALRDPSEQGLARARRAAAEMERNTRELQERVLSVRMVPIGTIFNRFQRLVRDLAQTTHKQITLELAGDETEVDKGIVEQIVDPLTHLIRNSLDHGIEAPTDREAAGKDPVGTIRLSAYHRGGSVVIDVGDDGRGLDPGKIRQKGIAAGLIRSDDDLSEDQLYDLIFEPGLSTVDHVTDLSGRGVGMDVVRRNIDALNGSLSLTSTPGAGTSFRIRLPLTLAIVDGLSLRVGDQMFVLPLLSIVESFRPTPAQVKSVLRKGEIVQVRGESIPLVRLYALLAVAPERTDPTSALVVIVESGGKKIGLLVDDLLGQSQVVVKSLEAHYRKVEGVMGATILGDGRVALILDVEGLVRRAFTGTRTPQNLELSGPARQPNRADQPMQGVG